SVAPHHRRDGREFVTADFVLASEEESLEDRDAADERERSRIALAGVERLAESAYVIGLETHRQHVRLFGPAFQNRFEILELERRREGVHIAAQNAAGHREAQEEALASRRI